MLLSLPLFQFFQAAVFLYGVGRVLFGLTVAEQIVACDVLVDVIHFRVVDITEVRMTIELTRLRIIEPSLIPGDGLTIDGLYAEADHNVCMSVEVDISLSHIAKRQSDTTWIQKFSIQFFWRDG